MIDNRIRTWQQRLNARAHDKGFYDYQGDIDSVIQYYLGAAGKAADPDSVRGALRRILADYQMAMHERKLLLVIGELVEAHEELRAGHDPAEVYYTPTGLDGLKPDGFGVELADAVIRILDLAQEAGVDVEARMVEKDAYNATRPQKHGRHF